MLEVSHASARTEAVRVVRLPRGKSQEAARPIHQQVVLIDGSLQRHRANARLRLSVVHMSEDARVVIDSGVWEVRIGVRPGADAPAPVDEAMLERHGAP